MTFRPERPAGGSFDHGSGGGEGPACTAELQQARADEHYYTDRMRASLARAGASADSTAKLAHYELAGRYSVAALAAGRRHAPERCRR